MIFFLLPVFNEELNIKEQISRLSAAMAGLQLPVKFLAVDDGSRDHTAAELNRLKADIDLELLTHPHNLGPGAAFKTGFLHLIPKLADDDWVVTLDADNTQSLESLTAMFARLREGYDIVLASVYASGGKFVDLPFKRFLLTSASNLLYTVLFPWPGVRQFTSFYRGYSGRALKAVAARYGDRIIGTDGFAAMAELLLKFRALSLKAIEVPVVNVYSAKKGKSKLRIMPTIKEHLGVIYRNRWGN